MINLLKKGILLIKNLAESKVLNKIHDFQLSRRNSTFSFLILVGIITILIYKMLNKSFIENFVMFLIFYIASAFVLRYEEYIKIVRDKILDKLKSNNKVITVIHEGVNLTFNAVLNLNSVFLANKLLYAYPLAIIFKLLRVNLSYFIYSSIHNNYIPFKEYIRTIITSNFNISIAMCFGIYLTLALTRENIFPFIEEVVLIFMNRKSNKNYKRDLNIDIFVFIGIYLFFTLLFGSVFGMFLEIIAKNIIKTLGYGVVLFILFLIFIILSVNYSTVKK